MDNPDFSDRELLERCLVQRRDEAAWSEFVRRFRPIIAGVIFNSLSRWRKPTRDLIDDLVHDTVMKVIARDCKALREFEFRHDNALRGFLKVVASHVVEDHRRRSREQEEEPLEAVPDLQQDEDFGKESEKRLLLKQMDAFLETRVPERDRAVFWLFRCQGLTAKQISEQQEIGLKLKEVEYVIWRLTRMLIDEFGGGPNSTDGRGKQ
ncbi:MAG TPA: sigma-70 family RNA polymerase sigma factor [Candidatus Saccharimonadales bacterium]|jgi:RNA polymerase sigma-70 factor (ECF subfamily)|nr:sigma-70 family RNA polymerase sigma factor [Candidatus Saccharimonadales bacterium]